ncbi:MAG: DUF1592 domain-containing protein [Myxococcales bacterium]|nr:DUF1592 domain-containing protein [Myxococcales bacterium]
MPRVQFADDRMAPRGTPLLVFATVLGSLTGLGPFACYTGANGDGAGDDAADSADGTGAGATDGATDGGGSTDGGPGAAECGGVGSGYAPMRRLTAVQYRNTIDALFGGAVAPGDSFPTTSIHKNYSNNPVLNVVSLPAAMDLLQAAEDVATQVIDDVDTIVTCPGAQDQSCASAFIDDFGARAFRRPLEPDERAALLSLYDGASATDGFADGIGTVVAAVLQSPQFLYLVEQGGETIEPGVVALGDYEIATRLSYLLWDSMPDAALFEAAAAGELQDPDAIEAQVVRMLGDVEQSGPALERFVREWNHYDGVAAYDKDAVAYPQFTTELAAAMDEELSRFIRGVLRSDEPTLERLLTATETEIDPQMAALFGVPAPSPDGWGAATLDANRGGLLTRPAILAEHSHANNTGPIFRGELVRTQLLCEPMPPPPADAMANTPAYPDGATERQRSEILMNHMGCGGCHALMNPIGLGFEDYDAIGAWRELDVDGGPIDNQGEIVGGPEAVTGEFHGVAELQAKLAASDEVTACFASQLYQYTFGLEAAQVLECAVEPVAAEFVAAGGDVRALVVALARSNAFRTRIVEDQ